MSYSKKDYIIIFTLIGVLGVSFVFIGFLGSRPYDGLANYPDFITKTENYFQTRISAVPVIDASSYQLEVSGEVENPSSFSLEELQNLVMIEIPLTTECIGNRVKGNLISMLGMSI